MGVSFMMGIEPKPDVRVVKRYTVRNVTNNWTPIYRRSLPFIYSIEVRNMDNSATVYYSEDENPTGNNYDEISPKGSVTEKYDPPELYANTSTGTVLVLVLVKAYSAAYVKRMSMGIMEALPKNPKRRNDASGKELNPLTQYYYGTDKVFPPPAK